MVIIGSTGLLPGPSGATAERAGQAFARAWRGCPAPPAAATAGSAPGTTHAEKKFYRFSTVTPAGSPDRVRIGLGSGPSGPHSCPVDMKRNHV